MESDLNTEKILKAGKITKETRDYTRTIVKAGVPLLELAEKIEARIAELGGKPAFPVTLCINNVAAHCTPGHDSKEVAQGLLKVDFGVHVDGWTADNAFSVDLENSEENKKMIEASEKALENALKIVKAGVSTDDLGTEIQITIDSYGFNPIINLCGHSMEKYELHGGISIPNTDDGRNIQLKDGLYAIEPFVSNGRGRVRDGKPSGIYEVISEKKPRSHVARDVLEFIKKEYNTLPFCSRWIHKKFGTRGVFALRELETSGSLHQFAQLIETSQDVNTKVSQTEQTVMIERGKVTITTL